MFNDLIKDRSALPTMCRDSSHRFIEQEVIDTQKIANIIKAYSSLDLSFGYNAGYNYIISLLLHFINDEEQAFYCLVQLM